MNRIYRYYCKVEELAVGVGLTAIVVLTFLNALLRLADKPIIYADDLSLLLFSWTAFLGADVAMRHYRLVGMDIVSKKFSPKVQKILAVVVYLVLIAILVILIKGGIKIMLINGGRPFNTLEAFGVRYGAVTAALPVCGSMMIFTCLTKISKLFIHFNDDEYTLKKDVPDANIGEENTGIDVAPIQIDDTKEVQ